MPVRCRDGYVLCGDWLIMHGGQTHGSAPTFNNITQTIIAKNNACSVQGWIRLCGDWWVNALGADTWVCPYVIYVIFNIGYNFGIIIRNFLN